MTELPKEIQEWMDKTIPELETKGGRSLFSEIIRKNGLLSGADCKQSHYNKRKSFEKVPKAVREWLKTKELLEIEFSKEKY